MNLAIKLPNDLRERVCTYPLLHTLYKELRKTLDEDEQLNIHLISLKKDIDVLNLLPFDAFYHELEVEDVKTIFTMHRACMNFKMDTIDIFISTTDSFVDASIGKNLRAEKKIGYALGKNGWFLNKKVPLLTGQHKSCQTYELLKALIENIPEIPNVYSRELPFAYADWNENPYTFINLDLIGEEDNSEWKDFIELFVNKNFVFMCSELKNSENMEPVQSFIQTLPKENNYRLFEYSSNINFGKTVSYAVAFVSGDSPLINIAAYCGAQVFHLNKKEKISIVGPTYFIGEVRNMAISDPMFGSQNKFNYSKIFDELYKFIEEKTKVEEE